MVDDNEINLQTLYQTLEGQGYSLLIARSGEDARRGRRYGLIRFGSRVDTYLPAGPEALVKIGDSVRGGADVIARWN